MGKMPTIFVSHGMPAIAMTPCPTHDFLKNLGNTFEEPKAVLCISAHWEAVRPTVTVTSKPVTIHDFGGPPVLFDLSYDVAGSPELGQKVCSLLKEAGFHPGIDEKRGLDHGAWVPLKIMYPKGHIPVMQLSVQTEDDPTHHWYLGRALAPLREEGVLILGSGGATHNLPEIEKFSIDATPPDYARAFDTWLEEAVTHGHEDHLLRYKTEAPEANRNHPFPAEHFLPLFVPLGSAHNNPRGTLLHKTFMYGVLSMAAYAWH